MGSWLGGVRAVEKLSPGPAKLGTRYRETRELMGAEFHNELEVTVHKPCHRYEVTSRGEDLTVTYTYTLQAVHDATDVELYATCDGRGVMRLVEPLLGYLVRRQDGMQLLKLKRALEDREERESA